MPLPATEGGARAAGEIAMTRIRPRASWRHGQRATRPAGAIVTGSADKGTEDWDPKRGVHDGDVVKYADLLNSIAPQRHGSTLEPFATYNERVGPLLPNWPADALEQWPHRHWRDFRGTWAWLGVDGLSFTAETWSTERIVSDIRFVDHEYFTEYARSFASNESARGSPLGEFLIAHGTWPVPILTLRYDGEYRPPDHCRVHSPFTLLEGHRRLSFLRGILDAKLVSVRPAHDVWVVTARPSKVRRRFAR